MSSTKAVPWIECPTCGQRVALAVYVHHKLFHWRRTARPRLPWWIALALLLGVPWGVGLFSILYFCLDRW